MTAMTVVWARDPVLAGADAVTMPLTPADDGPLVATLVRQRAREARGVLLFVHGFVDYFYHAHVAAHATAQGWDAYALDLRRSGRSLRGGNRPYDFASIDEPFEEIDRALDVIARERGDRPVVLVGHSTGGLIALQYAARGARRSRLAGLVLNSPFVAMRANLLERLVLPLAVALGGVAPGLAIPGLLAPSYVESLHTSYRGEWDFDLRWKPRDGFPVRLGWLHAVADGQASVRRAPAPPIPALLLRSARGVRSRRWRPAVQTADTVLSPADMARWAAAANAAGGDVQERVLDGALHDVFCSAPAVRAAAFAALDEWLTTRIARRLTASS